MQPVIQEEATGCGIAAVATLLQLSYAVVRSRANALGIFAEDERLFSDTGYVRDLLASYGVQVAADETPFSGWDQLPELALLAIKYRLEQGRAFWHWVVFCRQHEAAAVFDSSAALTAHLRTDFETMHPQWFITVQLPQEKTNRHDCQCR